MMFADQQLLFVGSYSPAEEAGIYAFDFDSSTAALISQGSFAGIAKPSFLVPHPNGRWLYVVSETGLESDGRYGAVYAFHIDRDPLMIQAINQQSTDGDWPCHLSIDGSGRWLLAANYGTGSVAVYPIQTDGGLEEMAAFVAHQGQGPNQERQERAHAHSTTLTPDNRFVIVADLGIDQLVIYQFDEVSGGLLPHAITETRPGAGPRHCAFHPNGRRLYLANELDNTVTVYDYDGELGHLHELQTLDTLPPGAPENTVADIHISTSGNRVYVSNRGHNSVAVFAVDENGSLKSLGFPSCGGDWPRNFSLSPDGRFMLVANRYSNEISLLPVQAGGVELGERRAQVSVSEPSCVQFLIG